MCSDLLLSGTKTLSFTSTLDAIVPFVNSLAEFFKGVNISIIDPVDGILSVDLGILFSEYNRVCNYYQSFDISSKCVGDDARCHNKTPYGQISMADREYVFWAFSGIGVLNFDKLMIHRQSQ